MNNYLVAIAAGGEADDLVERDLAFDSVGEEGVGGGHVEDVLVGHDQGSFLAFVDMVDLDDRP